ncbi:hypothetical protein [uncultured Nostoc sp.]|uniref:hypothetical protein n=1 Tax=uncultured Nostoc sp. TaxID=340711 RepID=UPI0035CBC974
MPTAGYAYASLKSFLNQRVSLAKAMSTTGCSVTQLYQICRSILHMYLKVRSLPP